MEEIKQAPSGALARPGTANPHHHGSRHDSSGCACCTTISRAVQRAPPAASDDTEPTLKRGDIALVAPADRFDGDGVYVLEIHGEPTVYRIVSAGPSLIVSSYTSWNLSRAEVDPKVLAKVAGRFQVINRALVPDELQF